MVSCVSVEQGEELVAFASSHFPPGRGTLLAICSQTASGTGTPGLGLLGIVWLFLFRPPHLQIRLPACLPKERAAQGKRSCAGTLPPRC